MLFVQSALKKVISNQDFIRKPIDISSQLLQGLFKQGEWVTRVLGLPQQAGQKVALVYKQISQVGVTLSPGSTLPAFVMREILCNVQDLKQNLEDTLNLRKKRENIITVYRKQLILFIIQHRNWTILFRLSRLLVMHDGGKLLAVEESSLAECLQGRQGQLPCKCVM